MTLNQMFLQVVFWETTSLMACTRTCFEFTKWAARCGIDETTAHEVYTSYIQARVARL